MARDMTWLQAQQASKFLSSGRSPHRGPALRCAMAVAAVLMAAAGCNGTSDSGGDGSGSTTAATLPPASIETKPRGTTAADTPQSLLAEITRLHALPDTVVEVRYRDGERQEANPRAPTDEETAAEQRRRCRRIVELATAAIKLVHSDPGQEQLFNNAVHYLSDARMQLALLGDATEAQSLSDDAEDLFERDPTSFAAVESAYKVVQLADSMASRFGGENRDWVRSYALQARLFAERFPQEQGRAAVSLISAGRKCEQFSMAEEARQCYLLVEQKYPDSPFSQQIAGISRRLRLVGQPLELAGPTIDGGFFKMEQFAGKPLLVVFWASKSESFRRDVPQLQRLAASFNEDRLTIVGVNLDEDEFAVDRFLEETDLHWRQIFFSDAGKRGGRNPVARFYGVHVSPTYWLVDARGTVAAAPVAVNELEGRITQLVRRNPAAQTAAAPGNPPQ